MQDCRYRAALVLALSGWLLGGCLSRKDASSAGGRANSSTNSTMVAASADVDQSVVEAHAHFLQGLIEEMDDQSDAAMAELSQAAMKDPTNTDLVLDLTRTYLQQKHPEKALDILVRASQVTGASGIIFARLGMVYSQLGKDAQAVAACQAAIKRSPELMDGYRTLFFIYLQQNNHQAAYKVLTQAGKSPDTTSDFTVELAELWVALQRQDAPDRNAIQTNAVALLNRVLADDPADPHLLTRLADDYTEVGNTTNAVKIYQRLAADSGTAREIRVTLHDKLARIYLRQNNYTNAAGQLREIVKDDPANPEAYYLLGSLADENKNPAEAADYFGKVLLLNENFEQAYYDLARVQIDMEQGTKALGTLATAAKKFKPGFFSEVLSALAYQQQKDYTNAMSHYTAAEIIGKATDPKRLNGGFYFNEGAAYERAGKYDQAEECFQKSLAIAPDSAEVLNYLGYMWADRGVKLDQARAMIQKAVELEPNSSAYLDSLGWVLYKLNRPQEALPQEQKAIKLSDGPDATLFEHLGDIYAALKQSDKAQDAYTKSLAVESNDAVRKKLHDAETAK